MDSKTCTKCGESKPLDEYSKRKSSPDGVRPYCKACANAYNARYRAANRDSILEWQRGYRVTNSERIRADKAEYYRRAEPSIYWEAGCRSRIKRFGIEARIESFTKADLVARYGNECWHCGGPFEQLDHYPIPVSRGGEHSLENCRPSCAACNHDSWSWTAEAVSV